MKWFIIKTVKYPSWLNVYVFVISGSIRLHLFLFPENEMHIYDKRVMVLHKFLKMLSVFNLLTHLPNSLVKIGLAIRRWWFDDDGGGW